MPPLCGSIHPWQRRYFRTRPPKSFSCSGKPLPIYSGTASREMASRALSLLPVSSSFSSLDTRKIAPSSLLVTKYQKVNGLPSSLFGSSNLRPSNLLPIMRRRTSSSTTVFFMLPTAKPDRALAEKIPKSVWSARAIKSFAMAELEARKLKYPTTGTEALLMGILVEGTSFAARFLRANGIMLSKVREETVQLLGKSDMYYFSPEHPPSTEPAQRALDWAIDDSMNSGGETTTIHMLRGIWSEKDSAGHKILATLGFDDEKAKELAKSMDEDAVLTYR